MSLLIWPLASLCLISLALVQARTRAGFCCTPGAGTPTLTASTGLGSSPRPAAALLPFFGRGQGLSLGRV